MARLSVVSPVYNASDCILELCRRLKSALESIGDDYEIILVDDGSSDDSWERIEEAAKSNLRIKGYRLSRNFGQHIAITAGLQKSVGDWVVVMDCDLQDPPEVIPRLFTRALNGFDCVVAEFSARSESPKKQWVSRTYWQVLSWMSGLPFSSRAGN